MQLKVFTFNPFYENTYVLSNGDREAIIIDPGCYERYEQDELTGYLDENDLRPVAVVNTHCHIDHVLGNAFLQNHYKIPLYVPKDEVDMLRSVTAYAPGWGITNFDAAEPDHTFDDTHNLVIGGFDLPVILAPGHSPGHIMLHLSSEKMLIAGDVIFRDSIGRTDLPGGDFETLEKSIREKVYVLPEDTVIYPGHGSSTEVGYEKLNNPFVKV